MSEANIGQEQPGEILSPENTGIDIISPTSEECQQSNDLQLCEDLSAQRDQKHSAPSEETEHLTQSSKTNLDGTSEHNMSPTDDVDIPTKHKDEVTGMDKSAIEASNCKDAEGDRDLIEQHDDVEDARTEDDPPDAQHSNAAILAGHAE